MMLVSGCGGGGAPKVQTVRGQGYAFDAPAGWHVTRKGQELQATSGTALLSVTRYALLRRFRPALWQKVVTELDRAADGVARQQHGTVSTRRTMTIAGLQARSYDVAYERDGDAFVERIAFVLRGKAEYLLLCRYERGGDTRACAGLVATFKLT
jgi:hypothetical protein